MKATLLIIFLTGCTLASVCQTSKQKLEAFISHSDSLEALYPVEKVHLHLDKPFYAAGQTIWFKAYAVNGANQPSMLSKILYVDLISEQKQIKSSLKLPLSAGLGWGDIRIPDTLSEGNYRIRAYTQWMRNFGEDTFYDHKFIIVNTFKKPGSETPQPPVSKPMSVQFFPEGGQQIEGVRSRVGFKAVGYNGMAMEISGYVLDNVGTKVAEFKSEHAGMGSFLLTPFEGQNYKAVITLPEGEKTFHIPVAAKEGYVINVISDTKDKIIIRVTANQTAPIDDKELTIAVKTSDGSTNQSSFKMSRQFADVGISKIDMKTGIAQLTLFDKNSLPVAERLVFIMNPDELKIGLAFNKTTYDKRDKVKLEIKPIVQDQSTAIASFSLSVTDIDRTAFKEEEESTIFSELLIKSELKGLIEQPNYYFMGGEDGIKLKHLDNLLLIQGWRRLDWLQARPKLGFKPESGISISGTIFRAGSPVAGGKVTAFSPDAGMFIDTISNSQGHFGFDNMVFPDSTKFVIQGRTERSKANVQIKLDQVPRQLVSKDYFPADTAEYIPAVMQTYIKDVKDELAELLKQGLISRTNILDEVVVKAVKDPKKLENSSKLGSTPADYVFRSDQLSDPNLAYALKGKVLGFDYYEDPRERTVTASLARNTMLSGPPMMVLFVDGMYMGTNLLQVNMADVAYVEVLKGGPSAAIYGGRGAAGIIIVTTKGYAGTGNTVQIQADARGIIKYSPQGYTVARTFYSPDYESPATKNEAADLRSTIYWDPDIFSDNGKVEPVKFFTADKPGTYRVVVEGLDYTGRLGRSVHIVTVK